MRVRYLPLLLGAIACACSSDEPCAPQEGRYHVDWLEVPADCLPAKRLSELHVGFLGGCAQIARRGKKKTCVLTLMDNSQAVAATSAALPACAQPFDGGFAIFRADLTRGAGGDFEGDVSVELGDDGRTLLRRYCRTAHIALRDFDADRPAPAVVPRIACSIDDDAGPCPQGQSCVPDLSLNEYICASRSSPPTPPGAPRLTNPSRPQGSQCIVTCDPGLYCLAPGGRMTGDFGRCAPAPADGEPCGVRASGPLRTVDTPQTEPVVCQTHSYCDLSRTCRAAPTKTGEPCGIGVVPEALSCPFGSYCDDAGICRAPPRLGERCTLEKTDELYGSSCDDPHCCEKGTYCDPDQPGGPTCIAYGGRGDACEVDSRGYNSTCASPLVCACRDAVCSGGRLCLVNRRWSERCDEPLTKCDGNLVCSSPSLDHLEICGHLQCIDGLCQMVTP